MPHLPRSLQSSSFHWKSGNASQRKLKNTPTNWNVNGFTHIKNEKWNYLVTSINETETQAEINLTRKAIRPKRVETDAFTRPSKYKSLASCDLDRWLSASHNMCLLSLVIILRIVIETFYKKGFLWPISALCDLDLWPPNAQRWSPHALAPKTTCAN